MNDLDWVDAAAGVALGAVFAGSWLTWSLGVGLLTAGAVLGMLVVVLLFRQPSSRHRR